MGYWEKRQQELNNQLEKDEAKLKQRLSSFYDSEYRKLEIEIASYNQNYGESGVIQYRMLMEELPAADKRLLIERMDEFAEKYPQYEDLLPVRESIYKLNRLEGLQTSIRMQQLEIGAIDNKELQMHLEKQALRSANSAAELLGFGKNFYSINSDIVRVAVGIPWANGKNFSQRIWENTEKLSDYLCTDVAQAIARGDSYNRITGQMKKRFSDVSRNDMYRLIYTEGTFVTNEADARGFENDFDSYKIYPVGDGNVCSVCRRLASETFRFSDRRPGINFPPLHPWCRCKHAPEVADWNTWIEEYERKHDNGQSGKIANRLRSDIIELDEKGDLYTTLDSLSDNLPERSLQVHNFLDTLGLPDSKWSGNTVIKTIAEMGLSVGRKKKSCDIWLREDAPIKTIIHEHLHARSSSRMINKLKKDRAFEEGACELLAEEICERYGISYNASYSEYTRPLREFNRVCNKYDSNYEFALELFKNDLNKREQWILDISKEYGIVRKARLGRLIKEMRGKNE